ncbi:isoaspartyl peptidase/L-asparaginase family protein [Sphingomonas koreensis]
MTRLFLVAGALLMSLPATAQTKPQWTLVIHGGAGVMERAKMTPERESAARKGLDAALDAGSKVLAGGGSALDAVEAAVKVLEDDPAFNAGRGAVFTYEGTNELDASIMEGTTRRAGAVAGVTRTRNPISLARKVMEDSPHVMLSGKGADQFSTEKGLEQVDPSYFATEERRRQLETLKAKKVSWFDVDRKFGTVGAVAMDVEGHLAAATSTGGITGKRWGRIGDSPVIGAGTYADDRACAVSATGAGEYFIRVGVAHEICTSMRLAWRTQRDECSSNARGEVDHCWQRPELDIDKATEIARAVMHEVKELGGSGGVIFVTPDGDGGWSFNTPGMYRGMVSADGNKTVAIYGDE